MKTMKSLPSFKLKDSVVGKKLKVPGKSETPTTNPTNLDSQRARAVDLVVLPPAVDGARCGNCMYYEHDKCHNMLLLGFPVQEHWCCSAWDAPGTVHVGRGG